MTPLSKLLRKSKWHISTTFWTNNTNDKIIRTRQEPTELRYLASEIEAKYYKDLRNGKPLHAMFDHESLENIKKQVNALQKLKKATRRLRHIYQAKTVDPNLRNLKLREIKKGYQQKRQNLVNRLDGATIEFIKTAERELNGLTLEELQNLVHVQKTVEKRITYQRQYSDPFIYLAHSCIENKISKKARVHTKSREHIISSLITVARQKVPCTIIRLDIESFFNSINQERLLNLCVGHKLDHVELGLIRTCIKSYNDYNPTSGGIGIPQGDSLSAVLCEIYMQDFDCAVQTIEGVLFYGRFVDDIILVIRGLANPQAIDENLRGLATRSMLRYHPSKSTITHLKGDGSCPEISPRGMSALSPRKEFDFLGYKFIWNKEEKIKINLSDKKFLKYKQRIDSIFVRYEKSKNSPHDVRFLFQSLRALTSNIRLRHYKSHVITGVYYSNKYMNSYDQFEHLDMLLKSRLASNKGDIVTNLGGSNLEEKEKRFNTLEKEIGFYSGHIDRRMSQEDPFSSRGKL